MQAANSTPFVLICRTIFGLLVVLVVCFILLTSYRSSEAAEESTTRPFFNGDAIDSQSLVNWIARNCSRGDRVSIQVLPPFNKSTYRSPVRVEWFKIPVPEADHLNPNMTFWKRRMSDEDYEQAMELLRRLFEVLSDKGISYTLLYGTLLGSSRHFDMVPWDDDFVSGKVEQFSTFHS